MKKKRYSLIVQRLQLFSFVQLVVHLRLELEERVGIFFHEDIQDFPRLISLYGSELFALPNTDADLVQVYYTS